MGELAKTLRNPKGQQTVRKEGWLYEYGDPIPMVEDLIATRRVWPDITMLANDSPVEMTYGYKCWWDVDSPTLDFRLPKRAVDHSVDPAIQGFFTVDGRRRQLLLRFVEKTAEGLGGFQEAPPAKARTVWERLMVDDEK